MWWSCARPLPTRALQIHEKITGDTFFDIARRTDGFSGREIEKLMISVQADVYGGEAPELTPEALEKVVSLKVKEHQDKQRLTDFNAA
jgi:ATPase family AAA domain-containing protein 3A/B